MKQDSKQIAFLELYEPRRENLVRFAKAIVKNREEAMDLVQETTLQAYKGFEKLKNPAAFTSFLFTIASRIHKRNIWRKRLFFNFSQNDEKSEALDNIADNNAKADSRYDVQALYKALDTLPEAQREAVVLFEINGLSLDEIKDIQGASLPAVKSRVQRGRKALAVALGVKDDTKALDDSVPNRKDNPIDENDLIFSNSLLYSPVTYEIL